MQVDRAVSSARRCEGGSLDAKNVGEAESDLPLGFLLLFCGMIKRVPKKDVSLA
jgi:hypothetical protein